MMTAWMRPEDAREEDDAETETRLDGKGGVDVARETVEGREDGEGHGGRWGW